MKTNSFEDLIVWQKAHQLVLAIYKLSQDFPKSEVYGLTSQLRRAAISVPANIAEGYKKMSLPDKLRYLNISQGSLSEVRYYSILAHDLGYCDNSQINSQIEEVGKLLIGYAKGIKSKQNLNS